jgi:hypothetical protein
MENVGIFYILPFVIFYDVRRFRPPPGMLFPKIRKYILPNLTNQALANTCGGLRGSRSPFIGVRIG